MIDGIPLSYLQMIGGAFVMGWLVAKVAAYLGTRFSESKRDPRDDRIRSLEAELRIAKSELEKNAEQIEGFEKMVKTAESMADERKRTMNRQVSKMSQLQKDLKDSVRKTRELRADLTDRATENIRSEVKLREVETELEVSRATTDMIATGVLDYSMSPDSEDEEDGKSKVFKTAT